MTLGWTAICFAWCYRRRFFFFSLGYSGGALSLSLMMKAIIGLLFTKLHITITITLPNSYSWLVQ